VGTVVKIVVVNLTSTYVPTHHVITTDLNYRSAFSCTHLPVYRFGRVNGPENLTLKLPDVKFIIHLKS
jgi:hypothetical protein